MDAKLINPFVDAFITVMPMLAFQSPRGRSSTLPPLGQRVSAYRFWWDLQSRFAGIVVYNMSEDTAKFIASNDDDGDAGRVF